MSTRCCGKINGTVNLHQGIQEDLTKAMMSRLVLADQRRLTRKGKGEEHVQRQRGRRNHSVFRGLQVAYIARIWGVEDWTGTKVAKHKGLCVASCRVWILFSE